MRLLVWALLVALYPISCLGSLPVFVPSLFNERRHNASIGDPLVLYYFPECSNAGAPTYLDSMSSNVLGGFAKVAETSCPLEVTGQGTFGNSMNGVRFDDVRTLGQTNGLVSTSTYYTAATAWTAEFWVKLELAEGFNKELNLLNIGTVQPAGTNYFYACPGSEDFALNIYYNPTTEALHVTVGLNATGAASPACRLPIIGVTLTPGELTHLAVTFEPTSSSNFDVKVFKNGQLAGTLGQIFSGTTFQLFPAEANVWYLGSSPRSGTDVLGLANPWSGTIAMFAFYEKALTQGELSYLYNGFLPNNPPVVATTNRNRTALEDDTLDISFTHGVDYWDEDEENGFGEPIVVNIATVPAGQLNDDDADINGAQPVNGQLQYNQENQNEFNLLTPDTFTFTIFDTHATSAASTMEINIDPTNDKPLATSELIKIPAFQTRTIQIEGTDVVDCPSMPCTPANFQPTTFLITGLTNDFGQLREQFSGGCPSSGTVGDNITNGFSASLTDGVFLACYTAFGDVSESASADGIVGVDFINFTVSDVDQTSDEASIKVEVTSVLSIVDPIRVDMFEEESGELVGNLSDFDSYVNVSYLLQFIGIDNKCEDIVEDNGLVVGVTPKVGVTGCDTRDKEYVIIGPLPTQGELLYEEGGVLKRITEDKLETIAGLNVPGFLVPEERDPVILQPVEDYMNAAKSPLCADSIGLDDEQSRCPEIGETDPYDPSGADCVGILCPDFTTTSFNGTFGDCGDSVECPVEVFYKVKVGDAYSPDITAPGVQILVKNEFDLARLEFEPVTTKGAAGVGYVRSVDTLIRTDSGEPIRINAPDGDSRILQLSFQSGGKVEESAIRFEPDFSSTQTAINSNIYFFDSCLFLGCTVDDPFVIQGSASQLNLVLENLIFTHIDSDKNAQESLSITLSDPYPNGNAGSITINMVINFEDDGGGGGIFSDIQFIAIVAAAGSLCLMAAISWVACFTKRCNQYCQAGLKVRDVILRKNTDLNKRAQHRRSMDAQRNVKYLKSQIRHEQKEERRILGCVKFAAFVCPCLCKIDTKNTRPESVRDMTRETFKAFEHSLAMERVPRAGDNSYIIEKPEHYGEWRLEHDDDGHAFWWNPVTDQSQWHSPYPDGHPVLEAAKREKAKKAQPKPPAAKKKREPAPKPEPKGQSRPQRRFSPKPPPKPSI